jgi:hypothetical protein
MATASSRVVMKRYAGSPGCGVTGGHVFAAKPSTMGMTNSTVQADALNNRSTRGPGAG